MLTYFIVLCSYLFFFVFFPHVYLFYLAIFSITLLLITALLGLELAITWNVTLKCSTWTRNNAVLYTRYTMNHI
jgi:hypothetical protein